MNFRKVKNLFFSEKSRKKVWILVTSLLVVSSIAGLLIYESTKKTVSLTLDAKHEEIRTHADSVKDILKDLEIDYKAQDFISPSVNAKVTNNMKIVWKPATQVILNVDGQKREVWTTEKTVGDFLKAEKITITEQDQLNTPLDAKIKTGLEINYNIAFQLVVNDGGNERNVWSTSTTVGDFLEQQGIKLNELDRVEPNLDQIVNKDSVVNIIRVEKVTDVVEEPIDFAVVTKQDNSLVTGKEQIVQTGKAGKVQKKYEVVLENGKEVSKSLISEEVVEASVDQIVAVGTKKEEEVSRGTETGVEFYVDSTAYTANCNGCSGKTATGFDLRANPDAKIIAVDPNVIPLGTKVYVEGYGYAVAADTGKNITGYKIDVFFSSQSEAYHWGKKKVKIKILK